MMRNAIPEGLAHAAQSWDEGALLKLLCLCRPDLTRYARRSCESDDVNKAVQDALWLLYRRVGGLRTGAALSAWLFQVVRRLGLRFTRRRAARGHLTGTSLTEDIAGDTVEDGLRLDLVRAIGDLPAAYREVLIQSRLHRARALMRELLRPEAARTARAGTLATVRP